MLPGRADRPLIFLDVDGLLIPSSARPVGRRRSSGGAVAAPDGIGNPLLDRLGPNDGRRLLALGCELVWATTPSDGAPSQALHSASG
ncbi:hypothetical protein AB0883_02385 [Micromonospora sp. NPDC047812]|uniref:hypothetical protein n=1 Tax=Micromonospora sp. NPDC047812 TaxID=3155742 RepID=UPI003456F74A